MHTLLCNIIVNMELDQYFYDKYIDYYEINKNPNPLSAISCNYIIAC